MLKGNLNTAVLSGGNSGELCSKLLGGISCEKALSTDLVSDLIFQKDQVSKASEVLKDLWTTDLNRKEFEKHFEARLIALNKDYPKIPKYDRFRPIIVSSPLVKLLEARFSGKLREYLVNKMFPGQVGFVPECGVLMNLVRAVNLIVDYTVKMFMACSLISRMLTIW